MYGYLGLREVSGTLGLRGSINRLKRCGRQGLAQLIKAQQMAEQPPVTDPFKISTSSLEFAEQPEHFCLQHCSFGWSCD